MDNIYSILTPPSERKEGGFKMDQDKLVQGFAEELADTNAVTFPIVVDSFTNYWNYEFGSLQNLPTEIDRIIANKATMLGLME